MKKSNAGVLGTIVLFTVLLGMASGCGRDGLQDRCGSDDDCRDGRVCVLGTCVSEEPQCATDADCAEGQVCDDGACSDANNGTNNGTNNGVSNNGFAGCDVNDEGICVEEVCDAGECGFVPCDIGCPEDQGQRGCECVSLTCDENEDCPDNLYCLGGACVECFVDPHCPDDQICQAEKCISGFECREDADCPPEERCGPDNQCRPRQTCLFDDDCPTGQACLSGRCTLSPDCSSDADCPEGLECVGERCFEELCRGPEDCEEGELCDGGECVPEPVMVDCEVATPSQLIVQNQRVPLEAFAYDQNGQGVAARFTWQSSNPSVARVIPGPSAYGGSAGGTANLTASLPNGVACDGFAALTNPGPPDPDMVRVVVTDAETGSSVGNARVRIGSLIVATDATGVAQLADPMTSSFDVDVFHNDFNWLTVQGVTARDIKLALLRQSGTGEVAGFTGEFDTSGVHSSGNITLGLAGASLAGGIMELSLDRLLGDTFVSELNIPGVVEEDIPLPGGLIAYGGALGFQLDLKRTYYAQSAGGPRIAWGLAGLLPFSELLDFFSGGGGFDGEDVIGQFLPLFNRFDHGAQPRVFVELPYIMDSADIDRDGDTMEMVPDYMAFPRIDLRPSHRQNLVTDVGISNFPVLDGERTGLAVIVGGVVLPSPGFVPTGISTTTDENGDGRPDARRLSIAPAYGSLVGGRYSIVALTFGGGGGFGGGGFELPDEFSAALWNGQNYPAALSLGTFPNSSQTTIVANSREVSVSSSAGPLFRVRMQGASRTWDVWSVGPAGIAGQYGHSIVVPPAPNVGQDLFINAKILVDAIQTNVNLDDLVDASGVGITNVGLVSSAYNRTAARD